MADEYIRREDAKYALQDKVFHNLTDEFYGAMQVVDELPSADVAPVVHAHWGRYNATAQFYCSNCLDLWQGDAGLEPFDDHFYYCPNCGAKMDEEVEDG